MKLDLERTARVAFLLAGLGAVVLVGSRLADMLGHEVWRQA